MMGRRMSAEMHELALGTDANDYVPGTDDQYAGDGVFGELIALSPFAGGFG
jgi:hypothetical protein